MSGGEEADLPRQGGDGWIERRFAVAATGSSLRREGLAGVTTFLAMAYILTVNPAILGAAGMDTGAVFVATALAAALGSLAMGLLANVPVALAPGMGLNAYFAFAVVPAVGGSWQIALGCVFLSGILFVLLSLSPLRAWTVNAIPGSQKAAITAGIGLFLALIAFENAGLVADDPATLVTLGDLSEPGPLLAALGFALVAALAARRVPGAILIGVIAVTGIAVAAGLVPFQGIADMPPALAPTFLQMDVIGALDVGLIGIVFAFLLIDLLDTSGTLVGVLKRAGLLTAEGRLPRLRGALLADSGATVAGAMLGTSTTTAYIESSAGVAAGGRTGLTATVTAGCFLLALFFAPLAAMVPLYASAAALLFVAGLMMRALADVDWNDTTEAAPAAVTALAMPFTFSIATGIGLGFIAYVAVKLGAGRARDLNPAVVVIAALFALKLASDALGYVL